MSRQLAGLETSLRDAWKPPAKGSRRNHAGKDMLGESTQLAAKDEELEDMIRIYPAAAISGNHEDAINPKCYNAATRQKMGYGNERRVRCNWSASSLWRFCGASGREKGFAKSLGIQNEARWSRQCAAVQRQVSLWRKSPNRRHRLPGHVCTDCSLGPC